MQREYRLLGEAAHREGLASFERLAQDPMFRDFVCPYVAEGPCPPAGVDRSPARGGGSSMQVYAWGVAKPGIALALGARGLRFELGRNRSSAMSRACHDHDAKGWGCEADLF